MGLIIFVFSLSLKFNFSMAMSFLVAFSVSLSSHRVMLFWRRRRCKLVVQQYAQVI